MAQWIGNGFEELEERTLLAANVTAALSDGTLTITGDDSGNDITVSGDGTNGDIEINVHGQILQVTGGSTVSSQDGKFTGVTNIVINDGSGTNTVDMKDLNITGNLSVGGGSGANDVILKASTENTYIGGSVTLAAGTAAGDSVDIAASKYSLVIQGNLTESGNSDSVDASNVGEISVGGNVALNVNSAAGGEGYGVITSFGAAQVNVTGSVMIHGGAGNDQLGILADSSHAQSSQTVNGVTIGGGVTINGGGGDDVIGISAIAGANLGITAPESVSIGGNVTLNGGAGNDEIGVYAQGSTLSIGGNLHENGGDGKDVLGVIGQAAFSNSDGGDTDGDVTVAQNVHFNGGSGNDLVYFANATVDGNAALLGGQGNDTFHVFDDSITQNLMINGDVGTNSLFLDAASVVAKHIHKVNL